MMKNWMMWAICLPLVGAGAVSAGVILSMVMNKDPGVTNQPVAVNADKTQADPSQLIVGKWRRWGDSQFGAQSKFGATAEYFEDGTYVYRTDGHPPIIDPETTTGSYVVLSDGRLKITYESCLSLPCKDVVRANPISFPDPNTLWTHYEFGDKVGYNIYHRQP